MKKETSLYEEYGFRQSTILFKSIFYGLLNLYPYYLLVSPLLTIESLYIYLIIILSVVLYVIGSLKYTPLYMIFSYLLVSALGIVYVADNPVLNILVYILWLYLSEYLVEIMVKEKMSTRWFLKLSSIPYTVLVISSILGIYMITSYYLAQLVINTYDYVVESTIEVFQTFYRVFVTTRIGSLLFIVITLFIVYYVLDNYIYGLTSDLLRVKPLYALKKIRSIIEEEYVSIWLGRESSYQLFRRTLMFITFYYMYGLLYPLVNLLKKVFVFSELRMIFYLATWFVLSLLIYSILRRLFDQFMIPQPIKFQLGRPGFKAFYASLVILIMYVIVLFMLSGGVFWDILYTALSLNNPGPGGRDVFTSLITRYYLIYSEKIVDYIEYYVENVVNAYYELSILFNKLFKFLWGG